MSSSLRSTALREVVGRSLILAYKEQPAQLEAALREEGLRPERVRASYTSEEMKFSRNTRHS